VNDLYKARRINIVVALACAALAMLPPLGWGSLVSAFMGGVAAGSAIAMQFLIVREKALASLIEQQLAAVRDSHDQLMAMIAAADDEAPPLAPPDQPTLH
jgi:uncharacterized membrane protein YjjP (DUF1212 family)